MDRKAHWETIYTTKQPHEVSWFQREATTSLALIRRAAPDPEAAIIDVGGGASTLVDGLLDAGYRHISVLDVSPAALAEARRRLGARAALANWIEADVLAADLPRAAFDLWHDRAVFHFLTSSDDRARYVAQARLAVKPGGHVLVATFAHDGPTRCSGLPVVRYTPDGLLEEFGAGFQLVESRREEHVTPSGATQNFVYCLIAVLTVALLWVMAGVSVSAQRMLVSADPDLARIVTSDIPNFWKAFDRAPVTDVARLADAFEREYLDAGSAGLLDFTRFRIETARTLAEAVASRPRFYRSIRETTLAVDTDPGIRQSLRDVYRRLKALYPEAAFPDVYLLVGRLSTGGTVTSAGLLIAVEMNARDPRTPLGELSAWERATIGGLVNLPYVVAHEVVHVQQRLRRDEAQTLLTNALVEGAADFVAELLTGDNGNRAQRAYGNAHERDLWNEFSREMSGRDSSRWLGQGDRSVDRPADLGYYVGYKICEAFYQRATDKTDAVRAIIEMTDAEAFLRESRYSGGRR